MSKQDGPAETDEDLLISRALTQMNANWIWFRLLPTTGCQLRLFLASRIPAALVEHQVRDLAFVVFEELYLRVHHFQEEHGFCFGVKLELFLPGGLGHQVTIFQSHCEAEVRTQFVPSDILRQDLGREGSFLAF